MKLNGKTLAALVHQRNSIGVIAMLLVLSNLLLSWILVFQSEKIIILPPDQKTRVWFHGSNVSQSYLEEMALFFGHLLLDKSSTNCEFQHKLLLKYIHPSATNKIIGLLNADSRRYKQEGLNTSFFPKTITTDVGKKTVLISGNFISRVGQRKVASQKKEYIFIFTNDRSHWYLTQFKEKKNEEK